MRQALPLLLLAPFLAAADPKPFFNGKDLDGWVNLNCGPKTWSVKDGELVTSGTPYGLLRSDRQYENFEIEFEWMHVNTKDVGNSGFFVWCDGLPQIGGPYTRGIEVQVLVNYPKNDWATNHGDVFSVSGATCKPDRPHPTKKGLERCLPSEDRCKGGGEWNHYKVVANDGSIKLSVNGKEVSGVSDCNPRKGYLAFESEGAECHYKNLKFKELPSTKPKASEIAAEAAGFQPIFNHTDLTGWKTDDGAWKVGGGVLKCSGKADLKSEASYSDYELVFDWKLPEKSKAEFELELGSQTIYSFKNADSTMHGKWHRLSLKTGRAGVTIAHDGRAGGQASLVLDKGPIRIKAAESLELRNMYMREIQGEKK